MRRELDVADQCVRLGDTMRFSVALLKQIYEEPEHVSLLVRLTEVWLEDDGAKVLVVTRADEAVTHTGDRRS